VKKGAYSKTKGEQEPLKRVRAKSGPSEGNLPREPIQSKIPRKCQIRGSKGDSRGESVRKTDRLDLWENTRQGTSEGVIQLNWKRRGPEGRTPGKKNKKRRKSEVTTRKGQVRAWEEGQRERREGRRVPKKAAKKTFERDKKHGEVERSKDLKRGKAVLKGIGQICVDRKGSPLQTTEPSLDQVFTRERCAEVPERAQKKDGVAELAGLETRSGDSERDATTKGRRVKGKPELGRGQRGADGVEGRDYSPLLVLLGGMRFSRKRGDPNGSQRQVQVVSNGFVGDGTEIADVKKRMPRPFSGGFSRGRGPRVREERYKGQFYLGFSREVQFANNL